MRDPYGEISTVVDKDPYAAISAPSDPYASIAQSGESEISDIPVVDAKPAPAPLNPIDPDEEAAAITELGQQAAIAGLQPSTSPADARRRDRVGLEYATREANFLKQFPQHPFSLQKQEAIAREAEQQATVVAPRTGLRRAMESPAYFVERMGLNAIPMVGALAGARLLTVKGLQALPATASLGEKVVRGATVAAPIGGMIAGGGLAGLAQEKALSIGETPEETQVRHEEQARLGERPEAKLADLATMSIVARPSISGFERALAGDAVAMQNIGAGAGLGAALTTGNAALEGRLPTSKELASGFTEGALFSTPTRLGARLLGQADTAPRTTAVQARENLQGIMGDPIPASDRMPVVSANRSILEAGLHRTLSREEAMLAATQGLDAIRPQSVGTIESVMQPKVERVAQTEVIPESTPDTITELQGQLPKEPTPLGITPGKKTVDIPVRPVAGDPAIERRWQGARGITTKGFFPKLKESVQNFGRSFTRADPLLEPKTDGEIIDAVRMIRASPEIARGQAVQFLQGITQPLGKNGHDLFSRIIILRDMVRDIDAGLYTGKSDLPFGYKDKAQVVDDLARFEGEAGKPDLASTNVRDALDTRQKVMGTLRDEMISRDLLPEQVKDFDDYFHRQVLEYYNELDSARTGSQPDARVQKKGFQKRRTGGTKDYNTSYLESEYEVMSQMMQQIRVHDELQRVKGASDIRPRLESMAATARAAGEPDVTWQDFIPDDYRAWQPERGRYFYPAKTITEKTLNDFLSGSRSLTADDFRQAFAMGAQKPEWVLPDRVAATLDNMNRHPESNALGELSGTINQAWKKWQLFNPKRLAKYVINNQSGDLDIVMAYRPEILSELPAAEREMWAVAKGGKTSPIIQEARAHGVLDAGWTAAEIPDVHQHAALARLEPGNRGKLQKLWDGYWGTAANLARWREGALRLASYQWFKKQLASGKTGLYGASRVPEIDAVAGLENKAAKLSRELIGDYGNVSQAGRWIRERMIPFWSWMEINAPRYYRLLKNIPKEAGGGSYAGIARSAGSTVARSVLTPAKMAAMYGLITLFNNSSPNRRKMAQELGDTKGQLHLVLGRDENGKVQSVRFQGALSDALSWAGLEDAPEDIAKLASGERTIGDQAKEMALAAPEKIVGASLPIPKAVAETAGSFSLYPEPFNPRPIRDRWQHLARGLSMGEMYDYAAGIPQRASSPQDVVRSAVLYTTDPQEQAFFATRRLANEFVEQRGGERKPFGFTEKQNALHYFKLASQQNNEKLARKWWGAYTRLGGKYENAMDSIDSLSPTGGLTIKQKTEFLASLKGEKKKMAEEAERWSSSAKDSARKMLNRIK